MLCCVGDLVEDVVVWLPGPVRPGSDTPSRISRERGGSAANVAVAAVRAGGQARFIGQVGDDPSGHELAGRLREEGVDVRVRFAGRSGAIVALVEPDGERTFLTDRAACTQLVGAEDSWLDGVRALHLPAYSLFVEPLATTARHLAAVARERSLPVTVDPSSVALITDYGVDRFLELLRELRPTVLLPNAAEAAVLGIDEIPPDGVDLVVVKQGRDPVRLVAAAIQEVPVPRVTGVVDTTGAGDAFAGGFLVALMAGRSPADAAARGNEVAAHVLRGPGADAWVAP